MYDDFPYNDDVELKRRMQTRKGEKPVVKLANDIHALLSVLEGEPYSVLKDLISNARRPASQTPA